MAIGSSFPSKANPASPAPPTRNSSAPSRAHHPALGRLYAPRARPLWSCRLAEDPTFASAWAWLGRCCWFLDKFSSSSPANLDLAQAAFQRASSPSTQNARPRPPVLHLRRGRHRPRRRRHVPHPRPPRAPSHGEPESFTSLVHVFPFPRTPAAIYRSPPPRHPARPPPSLPSVAHTYFLAGDYPSAIETYSGRAYYLDAAAWAALGDRKRAIAILRERLGRMPVSRVDDSSHEFPIGSSRGQSVHEAVRLMETAGYNSRTRDPRVFRATLRRSAKAGRFGHSSSEAGQRSQASSAHRTP